MARSTRGTISIGLPSSSRRRSSAQTRPVPEARTPNVSCFAAALSGSTIEYSAHSVVPFNWRRCMLSNATDPPSLSCRIHRPVKSDTFSVRRKPCNSSFVPAKSTGIVFEMAVNALGLSSFRSIRTAHRPPCTVCPSTANVPGGPPFQPVGTPPVCSASKSRTPTSSERITGGCGVTASEYTRGAASRHGRAMKIRVMPRLCHFLRRKLGAIWSEGRRALNCAVCASC